MPISVTCSDCSKTLKAPDSLAGKKAKCPQCGAVVAIPQNGSAVEASDGESEPMPPRLTAKSNPTDAEDAVDAEAGAPVESGAKRKPCPMCGEMIAMSAVKCRFCGEVFDPELRKTQKGQIRGLPSGSQEDLRAVAKFQKGIIGCILVYLVAVGLQFAIPPQLRPVLGLGVLMIGILSTVFVFRLAMRVYSTGTGVFLGILTLIPCIGLIVLLIVNSKATNVLKDNGIKVGLLGAKLSDLEA